MPIIGKILAIIAAMGGVVALLSWFFGRFLERKFVHPLLLLKKRVGNIFSGTPRDEAVSHHFSNEVGKIVMDIEKLTASALYEKNRELAAANERLRLLSVTDQLTNLSNRHKMYEELEREFTRAKRYKGRFSVIMFDIDHLKEVNDTFGHQTGDTILSEVSRLVSKTVRSTDTVFRWGGDEFMVLCPEAGLEESGVLASRIHSAVKTHRFPKDIRITISMGVSEFRKEKDIEELLTEVDQKLYEAKARGRDTVVT
ncbi:MAG: GGDEF domain-containing protein [Candidatus Caldatribacteriaceae bacterium]